MVRFGRGGGSFGLVFFNWIKGPSKVTVGIASRIRTKRSSIP